MKQSIPQPRPAHIALNPAIIGLAKRSEITISGSLYAAPPAQRHEVARALSQSHCWIHADMFSPEAKGVRLAEIDRLLAEGLGPVDVHLLCDEAMGALPFLMGKAFRRVTFPVGGPFDARQTALALREAGISPWVALSPERETEICRDLIPHIDGVLVMLIRPGSKDEADLRLLNKIPALAAMGAEVGVDGGMTEESLSQARAAGATYFVVGRRLFTESPLQTSRDIHGVF